MCGYLGGDRMRWLMQLQLHAPNESLSLYLCQLNYFIIALNMEETLMNYVPVMLINKCVLYRIATINCNTASDNLHCRRLLYLLWLA